MTIAPETLPSPPTPEGLASAAHRTAKTALLALVSLVCCAASGPTSCQTSNQRIGPSGGEVAGVGAAVVGVVVIGTVVLVNHSHHTMKGCVLSGPNGLEVQTQNDKRYALSGDTANVKAGDLVRFHGSKVKKVKSPAGDETFSVQKISRDYGPCKLQSVAAAHTPPAN